jgi:hypothetical protein
MIELRKLRPEGIRAFKDWLMSWDGSELPNALRDSENFVEESYDVLIDAEAAFESRYDFGVYLSNLFQSVDLLEMLSEANDGLWAWLAVIYFKQLAPGKPSRYEHYVVDRSGGKGGLTYRHAVRTSFQLVRVHEERARVCLSVPMSRWGDMAEQMTARQTLAMHPGFMDTAYSLYFNDGKLYKGASSRAKAARKRKPGDRRGLGGAGRLALTLQRLDLTYDTEVMQASELVPVLPKEFQKWTKSRGSAAEIERQVQLM